MKPIEEIIKSIIQQKFPTSTLSNFDGIGFNVEFVKEIWNKAIDMAAENAEIKDEYNPRYDSVRSWVDKDSILKLKL